jgi:hypothetical protein
MNIKKAYSRDRKKKKNKDGMQVDNRNIFQLEEAKIKRALQIQQERLLKNSLLESE